jgi:hypothetical protein
MDMGAATIQDTGQKYIQIRAPQPQQYTIQYRGKSYEKHKERVESNIKKLSHTSLYKMTRTNKTRQQSDVGH